MKANEVREKYLKFMKSKDHRIIPSSGLVPENDPTTLFVGSGMQPLLQYFFGEKHPEGTKVTSSQKCFRAEDIDEVGDNRHTTFFEMLGNWSFGDYFKDEQLAWLFEFLIKEIGLDPSKLYITVFDGDEKIGIPRDEQSIEIWQKLFASVGVSNNFQEIGSEDNGYKIGMRDDSRIFSYTADKNWWSRSGVPENMPTGEPGGTDSEVFYKFEDVEHDKSFGENCHPNCDCGKFLEIGNSVFIQYKKVENGFEKLKQQNVDFGGGLERIVAAANDNSDIFTIDVLKNIITSLEQASNKKYEDTYKYAFRVITDHIRAAIFMIGDGVNPSNTEHGYFVRRLLRRSIQYGDKLGIDEGTLSEVVDIVAQSYKEQYPYISKNKDSIKRIISDEEKKFRSTLLKGLKEFKKLAKDNLISGKDAFVLFTTYGFPIELTEELAEENSIKVDREEFNKEMQKHKETSRIGAEQKFKGGLADTEGKTVQYHTTTHLMLEGLRRELGDDVTQKGSNITSERVRFDFAHNTKVQREILDKVEEFVNNALTTGFKVTTEEMPKSDAKTSGATGAFWEKYPDVVTIYTIKDNDNNVLSRELCGGPHIKDSSEIQGIFKIKKESSIAAGVRRIKAVLI